MVLRIFNLNSSTNGTCLQRKKNPFACGFVIGRYYCIFLHYLDYHCNFNTKLDFILTVENILFITASERNVSPPTKTKLHSFGDDTKFSITEPITQVRLK